MTLGVRLRLAWSAPVHTEDLRVVQNTYLSIIDVQYGVSRVDEGEQS